MTPNSVFKPAVYFWLQAVLLSLSAAVAADGFDPEKLSRSTVRVFVKSGGKVVATGTGFLWQTPNQVVTSLHVMSSDPKAKVIVEFGRKKRLAKIKSVLPEADLVLLSVKRSVDGWLPLTEFVADKPKYKSEVSALGFNRGALGLSTKELRKGYVKPEILQVLLPPDALQRLSGIDILDITLPIYYLDGSLLPGYSGSPIVNSEGHLIGIGDGGLESGAAGVSWVVPASNLTRLMASAQNKPPGALNRVGELFSGDTNLAAITQTQGLWQRLAGLGRLLIAPAQAATMDELSDDLDIPPMAPFVSVQYRQFEFVKVKTRTFEQLSQTSGSPVQLNKVFSLADAFLRGYKVDYRQFSFDIYEDGRFGLNLAIPHGTSLVVADKRYLLIEGAMFCRTCPYEIQYHARRLGQSTQAKVLKDPYRYLNSVADAHWRDLNDEGDFGEYADFRDIEAFGSNRFVLRAAFSDFDEPFKDRYEVNYLTAATNREAWFQAQGILDRFSPEFLDRLERYRGSDCTTQSSDTALTALCSDIRIMMQVLLSVHLTTFSNKEFSYAHHRQN